MRCPPRVLFQSNLTLLLFYRWSCTICGPKHRNDGTFKVTVRVSLYPFLKGADIFSQVSYTATAARTKLADPGNPVAIERAKGVPGLMTILDRKAT